MRVVVAALSAVSALSVLAAALTSPRTAHACSAGPDFNPVVDSELVVAGYITNVDILGRTSVMTYLDLRLTFEVDRYLYGTGPATLEVYDGVSGVPPPALVPTSAAFDALDLGTLSVDDLGWDGAGGACGALDADPRDRYWVIALSRHPETGRLRMNRLATFAIGASASDPVVVDGIARAQGLLLDAGLTLLPAPAGNAGPSGDEGSVPSVVTTAGSVLIALGLLVGARTLSAMSRD